MGINTKIILISCIVTEILTKEGFAIMAAFICILGGLHKNDRVASFRPLKNIPQRYENSKKLCTDDIAKFSKNPEFGNQTMSMTMKSCVLLDWQSFFALIAVGWSLLIRISCGP